MAAVDAVRNLEVRTGAAKLQVGTLRFLEGLILEDLRSVLLFLHNEQYLIEKYEMRFRHIFRSQMLHVQCTIFFYSFY